MEQQTRLLTEKEVAERLGLKSTRTVRSLRESGKIAYTRILNQRYMYPDWAVDQYIEMNTVMPCQDQTEDRTSFSSRSGVSITSDGPNKAAVGNEARARAIVSKLRNASQNSSSDAAASEAPVIRPSFR
ncbi:MAG: helix-turn-helix domain-containing protein [Alphaproteobacteria bacterium]|nr:helix-turn-helix domain-containing protein [Alphaproteobacteria bacterium]